MQTLYLDLSSVVHRLYLSYECIRYYAYSVIKSHIPQVSRRADEDRFLHLIAFIVYQTFKLNDLLIDTMLSACKQPPMPPRNNKRKFISERATNATSHLPRLLSSLGKMFKKHCQKSGLSSLMQS
ncbi:MAG: hypothetical protein PHG00_16940 [Methylococcales bacterium]|nr:hypothetical protein [Methylococcales bacterium]